MKKIKIRLYQKFANFIVKQVKNAPDKKMATLWFNIGMEFNSRCVAQEIYLDQKEKKSRLKNI